MNLGKPSASWITALDLKAMIPPLAQLRGFLLSHCSLLKPLEVSEGVGKVAGGGPSGGII